MIVGQSAPSQRAAFPKVITDKDDLIPSAETEYAVRVGSVTGGAFFLGSIIGFTSSVLNARSNAAQLVDQSGLNRATMAGFQQVRYAAQKTIWKNTFLTGGKLALFASTFSIIELGLSYSRGYWDIYNPLLAGLVTGGLYGLPFGMMPLRIGLAIGGVAAIPYALSELLIRKYVADDDLMPSLITFADVDKSSPVDELERQLKIDEVESKSL